jgi:transposase
MSSLAEIESKIAALLERNEALERENKILREELSTLKKGLFGRKSERLDAGQLAMFASDDSADQEQPGVSEVPPKRKNTKGHGRAPFAADVPRETIELELPEEELSCSSCGKQMHLIGEEVCERGHYVPERIVVHRYVKKKYGCPDGHGVRTAEAPAALIDRCKYEPSVYAHIATAKYCDHTPLHRLSGIHKRHGVHLPKQTMWDMLMKVDELAAQPILKQMQKELLASEILHADETPVTYRLEGGKGSSQGYIWDWRAPGGVDPDKTLVQFTLTRERHGPKQMLGDWKGTLVTDGYTGYDEVCRENGVTRAGCWAHARRKVKEAFDLKIPGSEEVLVHIQRLFWIERAVKRRIASSKGGWDDLVALRARVREERSRKAIDRIHRAAEEVAGRGSTMPKSKLGKALGYLSNQRDALGAFLDDARLEIHNNDSERDLRHVVVGRKNYLVFGSPRGGEVAGRLYSLMLSCKHAGIDPEAYLEDVLVRVSTTPDRQVASLTPWAWAEARRSAPVTTS